LEQAQSDIETAVAKGYGLSFDYYFGRPLKVDLSGDEFDPWLYDRDAGTGAAKRGHR
jgi:hypothetical protein